MRVCAAHLQGLLHDGLQLGPRQLAVQVQGVHLDLAVVALRPGLPEMHWQGCTVAAPGWRARAGERGIKLAG